MIEVRNLWKEYNGRDRVTALKGINLKINSGEFVVILGPSGSGKTTLLNCLSGVDRPTKGTVIIDGTDLYALSEEERTGFRAKNMGFVFQFFNLVPVLTALENVELPLLILGVNRREAKERAFDMLRRVGLAHKWNRFPEELSGGEKQRVAIARALVHNPKVVWADEPTGALDSETGGMIIDLLMEMKKNSTLVIVTHDERIAEKADRVIKIRDGQIVQDIYETAL
ncbi:MULTISPECIES: ABC transporter ATP-binding protein [Thermotoga]|uniref:ABC transporter, ATP-binding protein n=1 Tax=Thermotoga neapolitana (strain ATCC 49049 / DSM 4359 / NBRC 107923 / NS-E) TaxID=309803 RepID=B9KAS3_THENN|nr:MULTISPECIES: ABC transporter ATP-binding protein [Thermotoga]MDK2785553.1 putative transport system ATP-binding protein [Thermotoga sp.]HBF10898.1 ABC transporter ATP-binding protein [Thermotoga neapolitana]ACM24056.1 ABC transporter, ATP-binding protein [Thermotoga neapolitana DSM 4359]AJG40078.1 macrolide ABC transporter ATP-binding protein [Thermotoga sp. RQ7]KFZ20847.1 ABC transporter ATP-binding protein [Thermotoga neapolitana LA10]